jgi:fructokinase
VIIICGEALVDLVPTPDGVGYLAKPGGSPANVAVGLGRLGRDSRLVARLSHDYFGQMIRRHLLDSRVDLSLAVDASQPTTIAMVGLTPSNDAAYTFYIAEATDGAWYVDDIPKDLSPAAALHVSGSLALTVPGMHRTIDMLMRREHGHRVISFDPNPRPALTHDVGVLATGLLEWAGLADVVKVSEEDLAWTFPGRAIGEVATALRQRGPAVVIVTRGGDGVYALGPAGAVSLPSPTVDLVDTVGAGDAFTAGLLTSLEIGGHLSPSALSVLTREALTEALCFAQQVAAITCSRPGADPPWLAELPVGSGVARLDP